MKLGQVVNDMIHGDMVKHISEQRNVSISEARQAISTMSFSEYCKLSEAGANITPPSGNPITPAGSTGSSTGAPATGPQQSGVRSWPGKGSPIEVGMQVGIKGPAGAPIPGSISKVDMGGNGVQVKNPTTGKDEWMNINTLQPFMAQGGGAAAPQTGQQSPQAGVGQIGQQLTQEEADLKRIRTLAGIGENCSGGSSGAGGIAVAPTSMGSMQRRTKTNEQPRKEYTPDGPPKTIVGDTKPGQASGELSSNLAMRGKRTASRINNGFKR